MLALPRALRFIAERPSLWAAAAVPVAWVVLLALPLAWLAIRDFGPWVSEWLWPEATTWYAEGARGAVRWLAAALAALFSFWLALLLAPPLSAPALEHLVRAQEQALGAPPRPRQGFWFELRCGLEAQLGALLLVLPLWAAASACAVLLPGAALLLVPLQALPLALSLAWGLLDYPLTLRGVRARARFALLARYPAPILGFGLCFAGVSCVPGASLILLPAGVVAATRIACRLLPEAAPHPGSSPSVGPKT